MDIVLAAEGEDLAVREAHEQAWRRFQPLLDELAGELPMLRQPVLAGGCPLRGEVARLMWRACAAHRPLFVTPMAAVAGAVAQTLLAAYRRPGIRRAWVNNGGDIALQLAAGESLRIGLAADPSRLDASALAHAAQGRAWICKGSCACTPTMASPVWPPAAGADAAIRWALPTASPCWRPTPRARMPPPRCWPMRWTRRTRRSTVDRPASCSTTATSVSGW
jgi:hypothetical protein